MTITASAPGKIVLSGEYAVLWGAPAVCMAVDRRAVATVAPSPDGQCHVVTPGLTAADDARFRIVDAASAGARPAQRIRLDTRDFSVGGVKIGIGSSAALVVALLAAMQNSTDVFEHALLVHGELQGGAGSGIDVAAAVHGGLIEYAAASRNVGPLRWPAGLAVRVLWTGIPSSTTAQLEKLAGRTVHASRAGLLQAARRMAGAWQSGDTERILAEYGYFIAALRRFSADHDLGIFESGHEPLADAAPVDGLVYKPAGAGGGDIGVLFGRTDRELDEFIARHAKLIHGVVPCTLDTVGVRLEQT